MNIEEIVNAWKSEDQEPNVALPEIPVGSELSEQELNEVAGGMPCEYSTCAYYWVSCFNNISTYWGV